MANQVIMKLINIGESVYEAMLDFIGNMQHTDKSGMSADMDFIREDFWLQDTAVIENLEHRYGMWHISLVFAHHLQPLKFIKRKITDKSNYHKAEITAHYMRRLAAKDQRGTIHIKETAIKINLN